MIIKETPLADEAISIIETKFGSLYFFKDFCQEKINRNVNINVNIYFDSGFYST